MKRERPLTTHMVSALRAMREAPLYRMNHGWMSRAGKFVGHPTVLTLQRLKLCVMARCPEGGGRHVSLTDDGRRVLETQDAN